MSNKRPDPTWGPIVYNQEPGETEDPILILIDRVNKIKKSGISKRPDETINSYKKRVDEEINKLEHQISDMIYKKKIRKMGS